jgi:2-phosphosulfolactate phosphatase
MQISTSLLPRPKRIATEITGTAETAVVIDVLRATSVMATALDAGASQIVTCKEVFEAHDLAMSLSPKPLLCGERGCKPIDGFDLGNSPAEYVASRVQGRTLVLTTTNGTLAIESAADAARVIAASFLNFSAVVDSLREAESIRLICAGTEGEVTAEDVLLAGAILCECETRYDAAHDDDGSMLARQLWEAWFPEQDLPPSARLPGPHQISAGLRETRGGKNLLRVGYEGDLDRCAAVDSIQVVPQRSTRSPMTFGLKAS